MVPADSRRIPRVPRYSGYHSASSGFAYAAFTPCGGAFQRLPLAFLVRSRGPTTLRTPKRPKFGLFPVRSPLLGESFLFSFPAGTKMFQFPAFASAPRRMTCLQHAGFSHSDIRASQVICTYARLFAAYHVLRRLQEPRHPPYALFYFVRAAGHDPLTGT